MANANDKAAKNKQAEAAAPVAKETKRRTLTPEEKIAKLEAELKATREKASAKVQKQVDELLERKASLTSQIEERQAKIRAIHEQLVTLGHDVEAPVQAEGNVREIHTA